MIHSIYYLIAAIIISVLWLVERLRFNRYKSKQIEKLSESQLLVRKLEHQNQNLQYKNKEFRDSVKNLNLSLNEWDLASMPIHSLNYARNDTHTPTLVARALKHLVKSKPGEIK